MRIVVIGPGATGCLFAVLLARAGHKCFLMDKNKRRAGCISRNGVTLESGSIKHTESIPVFTPPDCPCEPDLVIFCVKSFDTESAARGAASFIKPGTAVLTLQNGLGNIETICENISNAVIFGGVTTHGVTLLGDGRVLHAGIGNIVVGAVPDNNHEQAVELAGMLSDAGLFARPVRSLMQTLWSKLVINSAIGPVTALAGLKNGEILEQPHFRELLRKTALESAGVAKAADIEPVYTDAITATEEVCVKTAKNVSSMLQDIRAGRRTEIDFINGKIVEKAESIGMDSPVNRDLVREIGKLEQKHRR